MRYLIIIEETTTGYSAYSPDLPGCVSTGETREELEQNMREAIQFHIKKLELEGYEILQPSTSSVYIEVAA
ncbi:type II toxin-antitoxin system HicB family antitoxin [Chroococcidiopsis sp. FACHB-1243]|uniref:type II toxin-antitoxin system HicB family antitoxin n=1 Tax=Chroococcidiopsis sp. [FACHB-1243] TaxID=2692781 RepID=UPI0017859F0D|nr:type II toxin-antitoxin system HicB family antitoxin [Chroococcidiopsis sp. [FACHB-1243]]MBD2306548.1 type II toxin-antitoxin system HicB family antitoxin [Chroococcidiopsis sp. [FACHB-1243]]